MIIHVLSLEIYLQNGSSIVLNVSAFLFATVKTRMYVDNYANIYIKEGIKGYPQVLGRFDYHRMSW